MSSRGMAQPIRLEQPWSDEELAAVLPWPGEYDNKYSRGKLVLMAGSRRYPGAACLATRAAQRMGAGYVEVVVSDFEVKRLVLGSCPSAVVRLLDEFEVADLGRVKPGHPQAVCIGPGFDAADSSSVSLVEQVLQIAECPVLVDGGALAALGSKRAKAALAKRKEEGLATVVTPHGGEAARLAGVYGIGTKTSEALALELAEALGATVVLKGPDTFVSNGIVVHPMLEGTPALAKAGTGDVLAGMVASLLAQGLSPVKAALLGATLHARAGILAARDLTDIGVLPEDLADYLPAVIKSMKSL